MKAILAFGLLAALLTPGSKADPETVEGLLKKRSNTWQVPIVAKQPNENKPTQVVGGYPQLAPDTLSRPLNPKQGSLRPFGQYLPPVPSAPTTQAAAANIPNHILQWLAQRQQQQQINIKTSNPSPPVKSTERPLLTAAEAGISIGATSDLNPLVSQNDLIGKPVQRAVPGASSLAAMRDFQYHPTNQNAPQQQQNQPPQRPLLTKTTPKPKLIQRPTYNPALSGRSQNEKKNNENLVKTEENVENLVAETTSAEEANDDDMIISPKVAAIIMDDYMARKKDKLSVAGLVIGLTFVAAFIAIAIGLVGHGVVKRCRHVSHDSGRSSRNSWMRSPGDEDRTPPELRPGSNCSGQRRNSNRTRHIPGTLPGHGGTPFFNGKLILHDPPGLANGARGVSRPFNPGNVLGGISTTNGNTGFMMTSPPSKLGAIPKKLPSPAAQITDTLVSPKYEDGDTTEEEDSDDTVYECPGLGATKGMEVRNPFFLGGNEMQPNAKLANKKPISQYTDLFRHQEILGLN